MPLPRALLDDPAFSPDPRSHPHFPLANARFYRTLPTKSPDRSSPTSVSESDSLASPSPTASSATSPPQSPPRSRGSGSPLSPLSANPKSPNPPQRPSVPEILPRSDGVLKPLSTNIPRKAKMKAFIRRLTTRHNLDRIDELDETDPFGGSYHHDGPYEAIGTNLAQPTLPAPRRAHTHHSKRESDPRPLRPAQHQAPPAYGETGLSLHLEPGQILQPNTIYGSHISSITAVPAQFLPQPTTILPATRPDPSRRQSLPNARTRHHKDTPSLHLRDGSQIRQSSSLRAPRQRYLGDYAPDIPNSPPPHHHHAASYVRHHTEKTVLPPPRYESRSLASDPPRSPQHTPPPSFNPTSLETQSTENTPPAPPHVPRHKSVHSLDSSHMISGMFSQSSSAIQNKPSDPPRMRHLPKRLVMPAPLQPQPPQPHYNFPPAEPPSWQGEYPLDIALEGAHFEGKPILYSQEQRLLRKKSSAFPAKTPIPDHAPVSQNDAAPIMGNSSTKTANEAEGTTEKTRRRRLSKRKGDI